MLNLKMFCISLNPKHLEIIKKLEYLAVGLGDKRFSKEWTQDKSEINISFKNKYYGEYTFHYWLWKNKKIIFSKNTWIGFCQYRKFWKKNFLNYNYDNFRNFNNIILKKIPKSLTKFESIIGEDLYINQFRLSKFVKHNFKKMILNPSFFFNKNKRSIKFHFDMMHGEGNLDAAIQKLNIKEREDFRYFVNTNTSFNPHNMFICRDKKILYSYYDSLFPWLESCEKVFGFKKLKGYGLQRIYGFLAERYMPYWFKKYTKFSTLPIIFKDINDFLK